MLSLWKLSCNINRLYLGFPASLLKALTYIKVCGADFSFIHVSKGNSEVLQQHSFLFPFGIFRLRDTLVVLQASGATLHWAGKTLPDEARPQTYYSISGTMTSSSLFNCKTKRSPVKSGWTLINHLKILEIKNLPRGLFLFVWGFIICLFYLKFLFILVVRWRLCLTSPLFTPLQ